MTSSPKRVLLSWSSGKDSAWTLRALRRDPTVEVVGLFTTFNEAADRVAMHAVRRALVLEQASAARLPLYRVELPFPCSNEQYEERTGAALARRRDAGVTHVAFGDLFLEDVRRYRERQVSAAGLEPLFPIWRPEGGTAALAREMVEAGLSAVLTCVDPKALPPEFAGRSFDARLLADLPSDVDPCGENGEFHTFCHAGPMFAWPIDVRVGERVTRDGFCFADVEVKDL